LIKKLSKETNGGEPSDRFTNFKINCKYILIGVIMVFVVAGGILSWQYWPVKKEVEIPGGEVPVGTPTLIRPSAIWNCTSIECLEKWHGCESLDCILGIMEQYGASSDARNFTNLLSESYLSEFQEKGKIDLGIVAFPNRANTNEAYYLLNGSPPLVSTEISQKEEEELTNEIKQDPLYPEIEEKYPNIRFWGFAPQFVEKKVLSNNNERFIFTYRFVNGCRICDTEYSAKIGFDFDSNGKFLKIIFLQIVKGNLEV
jgi:hypothetical protein